MDPKQQQYNSYQNTSIDEHPYNNVPIQPYMHAQYAPTGYQSQGQYMPIPSSMPPTPYAPIDIPTAPHSQAAHTQIPISVGPCITVKAKLDRRYKQFQLPVASSVNDLVANIKENFRIEYEGGASTGTAYILWLLFGFFGIHRFYLRQHSALSFTLWFLTGQFFGLGWLYDGLTLHKAVDKYNRDILYNKKTAVPQQHHNGPMGEHQHLFGGDRGEKQPSMIGAYLLWFFMGWVGAHRWYTGYHTPSSFCAWFFTFQMCGFGWLYDAYYTAHMVRNYKTPRSSHPFYIKTYDGQHDFLPVNSNEELCAAISTANDRDDKVLRLIVVPKKSAAIAYTLWFFTGLLGFHAKYLDLDPNTIIVRFFTGNYFVFGWIVDGINLGNLLDEANDRLAGQFVPSWEGRKHWPITGVVASTIVDMV